MGVTGLWRLIEPAGKPVPVETLENKVLAVDISIWLHQMVKGYQDAKGAPVANAHLMGLFQRLCKLLYFRIKPVFVFDGGYPDLKKETIAKRQDSKSKLNSESERLKRELALLLGKRTAIGSLLGKQISPKKANAANDVNRDDMFKLPALPQKEEETETESEDEQDSSASTVDLHTVDVESDNFKSMPAKEKYDLLVELKETRKMNSWGKLHTLPKKSDQFSDFQMERLLKRRKIQECLEETEKEMGDGTMSINELESLLNEEGIDTKIEALPTRRIASNNTTRFLLINNVKQALADARKKKELLSKKDEDKKITPEEMTDVTPTEDEELQMAIKMSMECVDEANTTAGTSKTDDSWTSHLSDSDYSYSYSEDEGDNIEQPDMSSAKAYIAQYSDLTYKAIDDIVTSKNSSTKSKSKVPKIDEIIKELENEKSVIVDKVDLSSDEDQKLHGTNFNDPEPSTIIENDDDVNDTQQSVIAVENQSVGVINLDTSTEDERKPEIRNIVSDTVKVGTVQKELSDDSSDSEFEEVPEENKSSKPVVELTLNMGAAPDDDIFADVFEDNKQENIKENQESNNEPTIFNTNIDLDEVKIKEEPDMTNLYNIDSEGEIDTSPNEKESSEDEKNGAVVTAENFIKSKEQEHIVTSPEKSDQIVIESNKPPKKLLTTEDLNSMMTEIQNKEDHLIQEKGRMDRIGRNITEEMTKDAQELLQIFGIPYIVAPMEAEAQCAFLEHVNLTDGTITDDSDIWLFGGKTVYKNFFNHKKHVMQFLSERIEKSFNLSREQLILFALLVGSDYTMGVPGIGPVTALEILASFPFSKRQFLNETSKQAQYFQIIAGLQEFKKWVRAGKRTDNIKLKKKIKNVQLTEDFPSMRVVQAYLEPNVEESDEKFTWGNIDITILRDYTKTKFGWSQNKLDEIIKPVLSRINDRKTQRSVQDYFKAKIDFQSLEDKMSKRVKAAVQMMDPEYKAEVNEDIQPVEDKKGKTKRKPNKITTDNDLSEPSTSKKKKSENTKAVTKVININEANCQGFEVVIPKTDRFQEIIPQREKEKQNILQNKLKAIEIFRKSTISRKVKRTKKKVKPPKAEAELSESSDEN
ncbi:PREDICTED: DNA repair protein complementing XP-G cells [Papilio xuthus]|uniref:DNA repair protein complementing XP-G cells n=1 Tax=Papilio xuthus TaxID=66420 RepID=A0AAJ6ZA23_PAPXU|nr:PREDICTED: DNA repair protein complementing XP-G cells [Papilio xuthus]